jgi:acetyltransferase-like isoleucine patch superfamily enzyme
MSCPSSSSADAPERRGSRVRRLLTQAAWLCPPSAAKNQLLRWLGATIGRNVRIGVCLAVGVSCVEIGDDVSIGWFNVFRDLQSLSLGAGASIGQWNWFSASPEFTTAARRMRVDRGGAVTSRHYVDCSGGVHVGELASVAGHRTTILSHEIDLEANRQVARAVIIGARCFISTNSLLLSGVTIPAGCVVAAGAVVTRVEYPPASLIAGVPARAVKPVSGDFFTRDDPWTPVA